MPTPLEQLWMPPADRPDGNRGRGNTVVRATPRGSRFQYQCLSRLTLFLGHPFGSFAPRTGDRYDHVLLSYRNTARPASPVPALSASVLRDNAERSAIVAETSFR